MNVIYEDNHIVVVSKAVGEIVQADKSMDTSMEDDLKRYIKEKYHKPGEVFLGTVHRIDRPVSGLVLFARTSKALIRLNEMFQDKRIQKIYWAIVKEIPKETEGTLIHYIVRNNKVNKSFCYNKEVPNSKKCILHYHLIASSERYHLLEIELETGRHHQIRAQLSSIGCPIKGDLKYGFPRSNPDGGICLHSKRLSFVHPIKNENMVFEADPPKGDIWNIFMDNISQNE